VHPDGCDVAKPEDRVLAKGDDFTLVVTSSHIPVKANFVSD
jgi:hypothetical protein